MKNIPLLALIALLGWTLAGPQAARAADIKFPEKGDPAFTFTVGDDVKSAIDPYGNLTLQFPKGYALVMRIVGTGEESDAVKMKDPLAAMAQEAFAAAKATGTGKSEPVEIAGKKGTTYFATMDLGGGNVLDLKLEFVWLDDTHVASVAFVTRKDIPQADMDSLDKLVQGFKFTPAK